MSGREMIVATTHALRGERIGVHCFNHRDAIHEFNEYMDWLSDKNLGATFRKSTLDVRFDGGGFVRFISTRAHMDGLRPLTATIDDVLRKY